MQHITHGVVAALLIFAVPGCQGPTQWYTGRLVIEPMIESEGGLDGVRAREDYVGIRFTGNIPELALVGNFTREFAREHDLTPVATTVVDGNKHLVLVRPEDLAKPPFNGLAVGDRVRFFGDVRYIPQAANLRHASLPHEGDTKPMILGVRVHEIVRR